ncbi:MAG TPA: helix-turn-helix transcriptional regulator [Polyangiaceae bacterium]|nr:helix-turn-helix transcriptional regulator [Polyangiaceae bacterium]
MPKRSTRAVSPDGHIHVQRIARRLARRLNVLRASKGWSRRAAASAIGVGAPALRRLESGQGNPSLAVLVSIARAFGVPLHALLKR